MHKRGPRVNSLALFSFYLTSIPFQFYSSPAVLSLSLSLSLVTYGIERGRESSCLRPNVVVADGNECVRDARACDAWKCVCVSGVVSQSIHGRGQIFFFATTTTLLIAQQSEMLYWAKRGKELGGFLFFFLLFDCKQQQKYL